MSASSPCHPQIFAHIKNTVSHTSKPQSETIFLSLLKLIFYLTIIVKSMSATKHVSLKILFMKRYLQWNIFFFGGGISDYARLAVLTVGEGMEGKDWWYEFLSSVLVDMKDFLTVSFFGGGRGYEAFSQFCQIKFFTFGPSPKIRI